MRTKAKELPAILTIADTMAYLSCSRQHVYDLLKAGRIRTYKIGRRRYIDAGTSTPIRSPTCSGGNAMPNVNRVVMLPADLYRLTMQYADDNELTWNAAVRALVERGLRQTVEPCGELS